MNIPKNEILYLKELMEDFPLDEVPTPEEAFNIISLRFESLSELIRNHCISPQMNNFSKLPIEFHRILFNGILSNAGKYRQQSDKNNGMVGFGGKHDREYLNKFIGSVASKINEEIQQLSTLLDNNNEPAKHAILYYQQFVKIHPFYDGNGRIARLIISIYLSKHDLGVDWKNLSFKQNEFISKLNNCHKRVNSDKATQEKYLNFLINFLKRFIYNLYKSDQI